MASSASEASTAPCWRASPDRITPAFCSRASLRSASICRPPIWPASSTTTAPGASSRLSRKFATLDGGPAFSISTTSDALAPGRRHACRTAGPARTIHRAQSFCLYPRLHGTVKLHPSRKATFHNSDCFLSEVMRPYATAGVSATPIGLRIPTTPMA